MPADRRRRALSHVSAMGVPWAWIPPGSAIGFPQREICQNICHERGRSEAHLHRYRHVVRPCCDHSVARPGSAMETCARRGDRRACHGPRPRCRNGDRNGCPGAPCSKRLRGGGHRSERGDAPGRPSSRRGLRDLVEGRAEELPFARRGVRPPRLHLSPALRRRSRRHDAGARSGREAGRSGRDGRVRPAGRGVASAWWLYARVGLPLAGRMVSAKWSAVGSFLGPSIERFYAGIPFRRSSVLARGRTRQRAHASDEPRGRHRDERDEARLAAGARGVGGPTGVSGTRVLRNPRWRMA